MDIPAANQHQDADKAGYLNKLSGRSFPYIPQWKRRYCVLSKGRLYYYEREDSRQGEKSNGVINLEYFDQVNEAAPKDCKKATNVFIITSQDRSFFDPGRHLFSADTLPDMKDWIRRLHGALEQIRNNNRPAAANSSNSSGMEGGKKRKEESGAESKEDRDNKENQLNSSTRERKKKKEDSHRSRKSARTTTGVSSETQTTLTEPQPPPATDHEVTATKGATTTTTTTGGPASPKGGIQLPGFSAFKPKLEEKLSQQLKAKEEVMKRASQGEEDMPSAGPTLTSVTKHRVRGPQGRRAPQSSRRTTMAALKKRASSLSALEHQDSLDTSKTPWLNRSLDVLEGEPPWRSRGPHHHHHHLPQTSLPYKAYNYSSDEDDLDHDDHSDSFPISASAMPPPPPPRSASYGLDMQPTCPPPGPIRCHAMHRSLGDGQGSHDHLTGSKHSIGDWRRDVGPEWHGSQGSLGHNGEVSGGASPVMDDLDNLLMNQSLQHTGATPQDQLSDEVSEGSTCRAAHQPHSIQHHHAQPHDIQHHHHHPHHHKKSQDLSRFAAAVRHLQRHVVDIDRAVMAVTGEVGGTRQEVEGLKEAVAALQADTHTITTTLSGLTQQAITAQHKITQATQDAERVQQAVAAALRDAEWAREEQLRTKQEYENLLVEVRSTLQGIRDSQGPRDSQGTSKDSQDANKDSTVKTKGESGRSATSFVATLAGSRGSGGSWIGPVLVDRSSSASQVDKPVSTYQSLFSKPSNFISGLTARHSLTKSVSFVDQKNKRKSDTDETKSASLDRRMTDEKSPIREDKKSKKDDKSLGSLERKKKDRQQSSLEKQDKKDKHQSTLEKKDKKEKLSKDQASKESSKNRDRGGSIDRKERRGRHDKRGQMISGLSDDDIPMADDSSHEVLKAHVPSSKADPPTTKVSTSRITFNFSLGKSSSSPTVSSIGVVNRPRALPLNRDRQSSERSISPESPTPPTSFPRPGSLTLPTLEESPPVSETGSPSLSTLHRPGSTPGPLARQGSMTTVPEDREVSDPPTTKRSGVYAISRQHSSPNIPLQRQGSGSMFPIQRQSSLGTVREGRLPRQESLTSVPEERAVVDCTLPLSPSPSMTYVPLSPSASSSAVSESVRQAARESMELVTGPVLAGSAMQEAAATGTLPVLQLSDEDEPPAATSSLKKNQKSQSKVVGILV